MAAETDKTGFTINGAIYEEPESLTMAEHRIIKRYTGFNLHDLERLLGDGAFADQDLIQASAHIAYRREHRDLGFDKIEEIVGDQDFETMLASLAADEDGDALPPASTSRPDGSSPKSLLALSGPSGDDSTPSSESSDENPEATGTTASATSSPASAQATEPAGSPI